jgi:hypothetical protein
LNLGVPPPCEPWLVMDEMVNACDMVESWDNSDEAEPFLIGPDGRRGGNRGEACERLWEDDVLEGSGGGLARSYPWDASELWVSRRGSGGGCDLGKEGGVADGGVVVNEGTAGAEGARS